MLCIFSRMDSVKPRSDRYPFAAAIAKNACAMVEHGFNDSVNRFGRVIRGGK